MHYFSTILFILFFFTVIYFLYKLLRNNNYSFIVNNNFSAISSTGSLLATQIGPGIILGTPDYGYKYGVYGIFYPLGLSFGLISVAIFGAKQLRNKNIHTIAELFEKDYKSQFLRKFTSLISSCSLYGILVSLIVATKKFFISLGIDNNLVLYVLWGILILYVILGSLKHIVYMDIIQIVLIFCIFLYIGFYYFIYKTDYIRFTYKNIFNCIADKEEVSFFSYALIPFLYTFIEQDVAQRIFSAKSAKTAYLSTLYAGFILLLFSLLPLIFGISARRINNFTQHRSLMIDFFAATSNSFIFCILSVSILCAIISTGYSLLYAISTNLRLDFRSNAIVSHNLSVIRVIIGLLGIVALLIANYFTSIITLILVSYQLMICTLFKIQQWGNVDK